MSLTGNVGTPDVLATDALWQAHFPFMHGFILLFP